MIIPNIRFPFFMVLLFSSIMIFISENRLHAQESVDFKHHEFRIGAAGKPFLPSMAFGGYHDEKIKYEDGGSIGREHYTPVLSFSYEFYFKKWFSLAGTTGVCAAWRQEKKTSESPWTENRGGHLLLSVMPRFTYFNRSNVRLYSGLSVGFMIGSWFFPSVELVPFGVSFGSNVFGFAELGVGTDYNGANFGIGYRF